MFFFICHDRYTFWQIHKGGQWGGASKSQVVFIPSLLALRLITSAGLCLNYLSNDWVCVFGKLLFIMYFAFLIYIFIFNLFLIGFNESDLHIQNTSVCYLTLLYEDFRPTGLVICFHCFKRKVSLYFLTSFDILRSCLFN